MQRAEGLNVFYQFLFYNASESLDPTFTRGAGSWGSSERLPARAPGWDSGGQPGSSETTWGLLIQDVTKWGRKREALLTSSQGKEKEVGRTRWFEGYPSDTCAAAKQHRLQSLLLRC